MPERKAVLQLLKEHPVAEESLSTPDALKEQTNLSTESENAPESSLPENN
jgi:hypothetical protein